jgi:uncharacterized protein (DUF433 family)
MVRCVMAIVAIEHIEVDDRGVAAVADIGVKVRQIVIDVMNGMTPTEIHEEYPHLSLAQIHAALAYYYDHQAQIDAEIEEETRYVEEMRAKHPNNFTRAELLQRIADKRRRGELPPGPRLPGEPDPAEPTG